jgi:hypothetical protein
MGLLNSLPSMAMFSQTMLIRLSALWRRYTAKEQA